MRSPGDTPGRGEGGGEGVRAGEGEGKEERGERGREGKRQRGSERERARVILISLNCSRHGSHKGRICIALQFGKLSTF